MRTTEVSERSFGWTFSALFLLIGALAHPWVLALAAPTIAVTLLRPHWLAPAKRAWLKFGELLNRIVSPVVFGALFFIVFTPVGMAMRLFGRDAMCRRFDPAARSYWTPRDPPGPAEGSFRDPF